MLKKREAAMGLHPTPALQSGPALAPNLTAQPSTSYGPSTLTSTSPHHTPAPTTSGPEPHYGSAASSVAPLHQVPGDSSWQQQGQLPPDPSGSQGGPAGVGQQQRGSLGDLLDTSVLADRGKAFDLFRWVLQQVWQAGTCSSCFWCSVYVMRCLALNACTDGAHT